MLLLLMDRNDRWMRAASAFCWGSWGALLGCLTGFVLGLKFPELRFYAPLIGFFAGAILTSVASFFIVDAHKFQERRETNARGAAQFASEHAQDRIAACFYWGAWGAVTGTIGGFGLGIQYPNLKLYSPIFGFIVGAFVMGAVAAFTSGRTGTGSQTALPASGAQ